MKPAHVLAIVGLGMIYAFIDPGRLTYAFGTATLYILLPALLFEAAWNLRYRAIVRQWRAIAVLSVPGVLITALCIAAALSIARVPFGPALLTGAILSGTDPIAVVAVFRRFRVPLTLSTIVECEALFNDAVCVVLYRAVLVLLAAGWSWTTIGKVTIAGVLAACGGIVVGISAAWLGVRIARKHAASFEIPLTVMCAYGAYFAADAAGASGIFATIACGIALRYFERRWLSLRVAEEVNRFWDVAALAANALLFFLMGAALRWTVIVRDPVFLLATLVGVGASRYVVTALLLPAGFPKSWLGVIRAAGLRGALSVALALALPTAQPYREAIIGAVFATAIATLIVSTVAVPRAVRLDHPFGG